MNRVADMTYIIPIKGLSLGKHQYDFFVDDKFFDGFENSCINAADMMVALTLEKHTTFIDVRGRFKGKVYTECDRCLEQMELELDFETSLIVKFARSVGEQESEDVLILDPAESELDMRQFLYDYICLALPLQKVHKKGECDPEMIEKLNNLHGKSNSQQERVTPFDKLKDLMN